MFLDRRFFQNKLLSTSAFTPPEALLGNREKNLKRISSPYALSPMLAVLLAACGDKTVAERFIVLDGEPVPVPTPVPTPEPTPGPTEPGPGPGEPGGPGQFNALPFTVYVIDGRVEGARVYIDVNGNGEIDAGDVLVGTTDQHGAVEVEGKYAGQTILVDLEGAVDIFTGEVFGEVFGEGNVYSAVSDPRGGNDVVVSPLSTIIMHVQEANPDMTVEDVLRKIFGENTRITEDDLNNPRNFLIPSDTEQELLAKAVGANEVLADAIARANIQLQVLMEESATYEDAAAKVVDEGGFVPADDLSASGLTEANERIAESRERAAGEPFANPATGLETLEDTALVINRDAWGFRDPQGNTGLAPLSEFTYVTVVSIELFDPELSMVVARGAGAGQFLVRVDGRDVPVVLGSNGAQITFASLQGLKFMPALDRFGTIRVTYTVNDGEEDSDEAVLEIDLESVNDAPTDIRLTGDRTNNNNDRADSASGGQYVVFGERIVDRDGNGLGVLTAVDVESGPDGLTYAVGGPDGGLFVIHTFGSEVTLRFREGAARLPEGGVYRITVTVTDEDGGTYSEDYEIIQGGLNVRTGATPASYVHTYTGGAGLVNEGADGGTTPVAVGRLALDGLPEDLITLTFAFADGAGDDDNAQFRIAPDGALTYVGGDAGDFEAGDQLSIRVASRYTETVVHKATFTGWSGVDASGDTTDADAREFSYEGGAVTHEDQRARTAADAVAAELEHRVSTGGLTFTAADAGPGGNNIEVNIVIGTAGTGTGVETHALTGSGTDADPHVITLTLNAAGATAGEIIAYVAADAGLSALVAAAATDDAVLVSEAAELDLSGGGGEFARASLTVAGAGGAGSLVLTAVEPGLEGNHIRIVIESSADSSQPSGVESIAVGSGSGTASSPITITISMYNGGATLAEIASAVNTHAPATGTAAGALIRAATTGTATEQPAASAVDRPAEENPLTGGTGTAEVYASARMREGTQGPDPDGRGGVEFTAVNAGPDGNNIRVVLVNTNGGEEYNPDGSAFDAANGDNPATKIMISVSTGGVGVIGVTGTGTAADPYVVTMVVRPNGATIGEIVNAINNHASGTFTRTEDGEEVTVSYIGASTLVRAALYIGSDNRVADTWQLLAPGDHTTKDLSGGRDAAPAPVAATGRLVEGPQDRGGVDFTAVNGGEAGNNIRVVIQGHASGETVQNVPITSASGVAVVTVTGSGTEADPYVITVHRHADGATYQQVIAAIAAHTAAEEDTANGVAADTAAASDLITATTYKSAVFEITERQETTLSGGQDVTAAAATETVESGLDFEAAAAGAAGNHIRIDIVIGDAADEGVDTGAGVASVEVNDGMGTAASPIVVTVTLNEGGATLAEIKEAIDGNSDASGLVTVAVVGGEDTAVTADQSGLALAGGADAVEARENRRVIDVEDGVIYLDDGSDARTISFEAVDGLVLPEYDAGTPDDDSDDVSEIFIVVIDNGDGTGRVEAVTDMSALAAGSFYLLATVGPREIPEMSTPEVEFANAVLAVGGLVFTGAGSLLGADGNGLQIAFQRGTVAGEATVDRAYDGNPTVSGYTGPTIYRYTVTYDDDATLQDVMDSFSVVGLLTVALDPDAVDADGNPVTGATRLALPGADVVTMPDTAPSGPYELSATGATATAAELLFTATTGDSVRIVFVRSGADDDDSDPVGLARAEAGGVHTYTVTYDNDATLQDVIDEFAGDTRVTVEFSPSVLSEPPVIPHTFAEGGRNREPATTVPARPGDAPDQNDEGGAQLTDGRLTWVRTVEGEHVYVLNLKNVDDEDPVFEQGAGYQEAVEEATAKLVLTSDHEDARVAGELMTFTAANSGASGNRLSIVFLTDENVVTEAVAPIALSGGAAGEKAAVTTKLGGVDLVFTAADAGEDGNFIRLEIVIGTAAGTGVAGVAASGTGADAANPRTVTVTTRAGGASVGDIVKAVNAAVELPRVDASVTVGGMVFTAPDTGPLSGVGGNGIRIAFQSDGSLGNGVVNVELRRSGDDNEIYTFTFTYGGFATRNQVIEALAGFSNSQGLTAALAPGEGNAQLAAADPGTGFPIPNGPHSPGGSGRGRDAADVLEARVDATLAIDISDPVRLTDANVVTEATASPIVLTGGAAGVKADALAELGGADIVFTAANAGGAGNFIQLVIVVGTGAGTGVAGVAASGTGADAANVMTVTVTLNADGASVSDIVKAVNAGVGSPAIPSASSSVTLAGLVFTAATPGREGNLIRVRFESVDRDDAVVDVSYLEVDSGGSTFSTYTLGYGNDVTLQNVIDALASDPLLRAALDANAVDNAGSAVTGSTRLAQDPDNTAAPHLPSPPPAGTDTDVAGGYHAMTGGSDYVPESAVVHVEARLDGQKHDVSLKAVSNSIGNDGDLLPILRVEVPVEKEQVSVTVLQEVVAALGGGNKLFLAGGADEAPAVAGTAAVDEFTPAEDAGVLFTSRATDDDGDAVTYSIAWDTVNYAAPEETSGPSGYYDLGGLQGRPLAHTVGGLVFTGVGVGLGLDDGGDRGNYVRIVFERSGADDDDGSPVDVAHAEVGGWHVYTVTYDNDATLQDVVDAFDANAQVILARATPGTPLGDVRVALEAGRAGGDMLVKPLDIADYFVIDPETGELRLKEGAAAPSYEWPQQTYAIEVTATSTSALPGGRGAREVKHTVLVNINDVNNAPDGISARIYDDTGGLNRHLEEFSAALLKEDTLFMHVPAAGVPEGGVYVTELRASDPDSADTHTFSLGGADAGLFEIRNGNEVWFTGTIDDAKAPGESHAVTLTATDQDGAGYEREVEVVRVGLHVEAPGAPAGTGAADGADPLLVAILYHPEGHPLTAEDAPTLSGGDAGLFEIRNNHELWYVGEDRFISPVDFPAFTSYSYFFGGENTLWGYLGRNPDGTIAVDTITYDITISTAEPITADDGSGGTVTVYPLDVTTSEGKKAFANLIRAHHLSLDRPPAEDAYSGSALLAENTPLAVRIGPVADAGADGLGLYYSLVQGPDAEGTDNALFRLIEGVLYYVGGPGNLDFEEQPSFTVRFATHRVTGREEVTVSAPEFGFSKTVTVDNTADLFGHRDFTISVVNTNDEAPQFVIAEGVETEDAAVPARFWIEFVPSNLLQDSGVEDDPDTETVDESSDYDLTTPQEEGTFLIPAAAYAFAGNVEMREDGTIVISDGWLEIHGSDPAAEPHLVRYKGMELAADEYEAGDVFYVHVDAVAEKARVDRDASAKQLVFTADPDNFLSASTAAGIDANGNGITVDILISTAAGTGVAAAAFDNTSFKLTITLSSGGATLRQIADASGIDNVDVTFTGSGAADTMITSEIRGIALSGGAPGTPARGSQEIAPPPIVFRALDAGAAGNNIEVDIVVGTTSGTGVDDIAVTGSGTAAAPYVVTITLDAGGASLQQIVDALDAFNSRGANHFSTVDHHTVYTPPLVEAFFEGVPGTTMITGSFADIKLSGGEIEVNGGSGRVVKVPEEAYYNVQHWKIAYVNDEKDGIVLRGYDRVPEDDETTPDVDERTIPITITVSVPKFEAAEDSRDVIFTARIEDGDNVEGEDPTDTAVYELPAGHGDNGVFEIDRLTGEVTLREGRGDYETRTGYDVYVKAVVTSTLPGGGADDFVWQTYRVELTDAPDAPTGIAISSAALSSGSVEAGALTAVDDDILVLDGLREPAASLAFTAVNTDGEDVRVSIYADEGSFGSGSGVGDVNVRSAAGGQPHRIEVLMRGDGATLQQIVDAITADTQASALVTAAAEGGANAGGKTVSGDPTITVDMAGGASATYEAVAAVGGGITDSHEFELVQDADADDGATTDTNLFEIYRDEADGNAWKLRFAGLDGDAETEGTEPGNDGRKELGDNYQVRIRVTDSTDGSHTRILTIAEGTVYITTDGDATQKYSAFADASGNGLLNENADGSTTGVLVGTVNVSGESITAFTIKAGEGDADSFEIRSGTELWFTGSDSGDFEAEDNALEITLEWNDGTADQEERYVVRLADVNEAPTLEAGEAIEVRETDDAATDGEDESVVVLTEAMIAVSDPDAGDREEDDTLRGGEFTFTIVDTNNGKIRLDGSELADGGTFTLEQLRAGSVAFAHDGGEETQTDADGYPAAPGSLVFTAVNAGVAGNSIVINTHGGAGAGTGVGRITVSGNTITLPISDGGATLDQIVAAINADTDARALVTAAVESGSGSEVFLPPPGQTVIRLDDGTATAQARATYEAVPAAASRTAVTLTVEDGNEDGSTPVSVTFNPMVEAVNDQVGDAVNKALTLNEGATTVLTKTHLLAVDNDNPRGEVAYTLTEAPEYGVLQLSNDGGATWGTLTTAAGSNRFTQQDIADGNLRYMHSGAEEPAADGFKFKVGDPSQYGADGNPLDSVAEQAFAITVVAQNDPVTPEPGDNEVTVTEGGSYILREADIGVTDPDDLPGDITYTYQTAISTTNDILRLEKDVSGSWTELSAGGTFTLADVQAGRIRINYLDSLVAAGVSNNPPAASLTFTYTADDDAPAQNSDNNRPGSADEPNTPATQTQTVTVNLQAVNDAPTLITASATRIEPERTEGQNVMTFTAADEETTNQAGFTYTLVGGAGSDDNDFFEFVTGTSTLKFKDSPPRLLKLDGETYKLRVRVTDDGADAGQNLDTGLDLAAKWLEREFSFDVRSFDVDWNPGAGGDDDAFNGGDPFKVTVGTTAKTAVGTFEIVPTDPDLGNDYFVVVTPSDGDDYGAIEIDTHSGNNARFTVQLTPSADNPFLKALTEGQEETVNFQIEIRYRSHEASQETGYSRSLTAIPITFVGINEPPEVSNVDYRVYEPVAGDGRTGTPEEDAVEGSWVFTDPDDPAHTIDPASLGGSAGANPPQTLTSLVFDPAAEDFDANAEARIEGAYGTLIVTLNGWSYVRDDAKIDSAPAGEARDQFNLQATDASSRASNILIINIRVFGENDAPGLRAGVDAVLGAGDAAFADADPADGITYLTAGVTETAPDPVNSATVGSVGDHELDWRAADAALTQGDGQKASGRWTASDIDADAELRLFVNGAETVKEGSVNPVTGSRLVLKDADAHGGQVLDVDDTSMSGEPTGHVFAGRFGDLVFKNDGTWEYALNVRAEKIAAGETPVDEFRIRAHDEFNAEGNLVVLTVTVTGTNDAPTGLRGEVDEDGDPVVPTVTESGHRADSYGAAFAARAGNHDFTLSGVSGGNTANAVPALETRDPFTVDDDTTDAKDFNPETRIDRGDGDSGARNDAWNWRRNDPAPEFFATGTLDAHDPDAIGNDGRRSAIDEHTFEVLGVDNSGTTTATGTDTRADIDTGRKINGAANTDGTDDSAVLDIAAVDATTTTGMVGTYGELKVDTQSGEWIYVLNDRDPVVKALDGDDTVYDHFRIRVRDEHGETVIDTLTITVKGRDDAPVLIGDTATSLAGGAASTAASAALAGLVFTAAAPGAAGNNIRIALAPTGADDDDGDPVGVAHAEVGGMHLYTITHDSDATLQDVIDEFAGDTRVTVALERAGTGADAFSTRAAAFGLDLTATEEGTRVPAANTVAATKASGRFLVIDDDAEDGGYTSGSKDGSIISFSDNVAPAAGIANRELVIQAESVNLPAEFWTNSAGTGITNTGTGATVLEDLSTSSAARITGQYGYLYLSANGHWMYDGNASDRSIPDSWAEGFKGTETFLIRILDVNGAGTNDDVYSNVITLVIDLTGVNDAPTAVEETSPAPDKQVTEDTDATARGTATMDDVDTDDTATTLAMWFSADNTFPDSGANARTVIDSATTTAQAIDATYGEWTLTRQPDGTVDWGYELDSALPTVQALGRNSGPAPVETLYFRSRDQHNAVSAVRSIAVTVMGTNDAPTADPVAVDVTEGTGTQTGNFSSSYSDVDRGDTLTVSNYGAGDTTSSGGPSGPRPFGVSGTYGVLSLNQTTGAWSYDTNGAGADALRQDQEEDDVFTYVVSDGAATGANTFTVTVTGVNDLPTARDVAVPVDEDLAVDETIVTGGDLAVIGDERDNGETPTVARARSGTSGSWTNVADTGETTITGTYGDLQLRANGTWGYVASKSAAQALGPATSSADFNTATETFQYQLRDGNSAITTLAASGDHQGTLTFTITGVNDAPTGTAEITVTIAEDETWNAFRPFGSSEFESFFGYSDAERDPLRALQLVATPAKGDFLLGSDEIDATNNLVDGLVLMNTLTYTPEEDESGDDYAEFTYRLRDRFTRDNGDGTVTVTYSPEFSEIYKVVFDVTPVNDAPTFTQSGTVRTIAENDSATRTTGITFNLSDVDDDTATSSGRDGFTWTVYEVVYTGSGMDRTEAVTESERFEVTYASGWQLWKSSDVELDYDTLPTGDKNIYLRVKVADDGGAESATTSDIVVPVANDIGDDSSPTAMPVVQTIAEDGKLDITEAMFGGRDSGGDVNAITHILITNVANGAIIRPPSTTPLVIGAGLAWEDHSIDGNYDFVPTPNFNGTAIITYKAQIRSTADDGTVTTIESPSTELRITVTASDDDPTGAPTITFSDGGANDVASPEVGNTLTASTSAVRDPDRVGDETNLGTVTYQWYRGSAADAASKTASTAVGTNSATYALTAADATAAATEFWVRISFTDGGGTAETVDSATFTFTSAVATGNAAPTFSGADDAGTVTEDTPGGMEVTGSAAATDSDATFPATGGYAAALKSGTAGYGTFTVDDSGDWKFVLDNDNTDVQALNGDSTALENVYTITATDSGGATATQDVTITINGRTDLFPAGDETAREAPQTLGSSTTTVRQTIQGAGGNDTLVAGTAGDVIIGGLGNDVVTFNSGADFLVYRYSGSSDRARAEDGGDTVSNFVRGTDTIVLVLDDDSDPPTITNLEEFVDWVTNDTTFNVGDRLQFIVPISLANPAAPTFSGFKLRFDSAGDVSTTSSEGALADLSINFPTALPALDFFDAADLGVLQGKVDIIGGGRLNDRSYVSKLFSNTDDFAGVIFTTLDDLNIDIL